VRRGFGLFTMRGAAVRGKFQRTGDADHAERDAFEVRLP
jgi:hypothetical protein